MSDTSLFFNRSGDALTAAEADALLQDLGYVRLARHLVHGWTISTIWLGLDFNRASPEGPRHLFETRITAPGRDESERHPGLDWHIVRYPTEEAALAGHAALLAAVSGELGATEAEITDAIPERSRRADPRAIRPGGDGE